MKAIIFCGGKGVRLRPLTYYIQKVMVPVGSKQRPIVEYVIRLLRYHQMNDIVLMVNYKANQIINYFENGSRFKVNLTFLHDNPKFSGTGGALLNAFFSGKINEDETLLIYYGDIISGEIDPYYERWNELSVIIGRTIEIDAAQEKIRGKAVRIDQDGALVIEDEKGKEQKILSGDVSVKL